MSTSGGRVIRVDSGGASAPSEVESKPNHPDAPAPQKRIPRPKAPKPPREQSTDDAASTHTPPNKRFVYAGLLAVATIIAIGVLLKMVGPAAAVVAGLTVAVIAILYWKDYVPGKKIAENNSYVRSQRQESRGVVTIIKYKGGAGATAALAWQVGTTTNASQASCAAIDLDAGHGFLSSRLGATDSISTTAFLDYFSDPENDLSNGWLEEHLSAARHSGALVVGLKPQKSDQPNHVSPPRWNANGEPEFDDASLTYDPVKVFRTCGNLRNAVNRTYIDTGPSRGIKAYMTASVAADVVQISAREDSGDSLDNLPLVLSDLRELDPNKSVMLIISAVRNPSEKKRAHYAEKFGVPVEDVHLVPNSRYIKTDSEVNEARVSKRVLLAWSKINAEVTRRLVSINQSRNTPTTP